MSEFVGRTGSQRVYSYPEPRRAGAAADPLARNFATLKEGSLASGDNTATWIADVPADPVDLTQVPITPLSTGAIEVSGFVVVANSDGAAASIQIEISVDGVAAPAVMESEAIVPLEGMLAIPYKSQFTGLTLNTTVPVTMTITSSVGGETPASLEGGVMAVQEVPVPTG